MSSNEIKEIKNISDINSIGDLGSFIKGQFSRVTDSLKALADKAVVLAHEHPMFTKVVMALAATAAGVAAPGVGAIAVGVGCAILEKAVSDVMEKRYEKIMSERESSTDDNEKDKSHAKENEHTHLQIRNKNHAANRTIRIKNDKTHSEETQKLLEEIEKEMKEALKAKDLTEDEKNQIKEIFIAFERNVMEGQKKHKDHNAKDKNHSDNKKNEGNNIQNFDDDEYLDTEVDDNNPDNNKTKSFRNRISSNANSSSKSRG